MNQWKFFDITHREHIICNPISVEKLEQLIALLRLKPGARVLEIATGKVSSSSGWRKVWHCRNRDRSLAALYLRCSEKT